MKNQTEKKTLYFINKQKYFVNICVERFSRKCGYTMPELKLECNNSLKNYFISFLLPIYFHQTYVHKIGN